jgi:ectoine hydroxylase-related dioxygenase (phytanoyl-CoA dioxygenase family)
MGEDILRLTDQEISLFHEQGFLRLERLVDAEEVAWVREVYDRLFLERTGWERGDQFDLAGTDAPEAKLRLPQLMNPAAYAPELKQAVFRETARRVACQLLAGAECGDEHAICKPAEDGAETPWHQDQAYWDPAYDYEALSIWTPLQEATPENGCMHFISGSHRGGVVPHHSIGHDVRVHGLETDAVDPKLAVACPLPAGGCTIHHCRTLHYAGPNRSSEARRAYILTFRKPPMRREMPQDFPWLTARRAARQLRNERR